MRGAPSRASPACALAMCAMVFARTAPAQPATAQAGSGAWFVPAAPSKDSVDTVQKTDTKSFGDTEEITVIGHRRPVAGPLVVPDLPGEDMSKYHREPNDPTLNHRAPCAAPYATVGDHEGRGSSLATGLGAPGCD